MMMPVAYAISDKRCESALAGAHEIATTRLSLQGQLSTFGRQAILLNPIDPGPDLTIDTLGIPSSGPPQRTPEGELVGGTPEAPIRSLAKPKVSINNYSREKHLAGEESSHIGSRDCSATGVVQRRSVSHPHRAGCRLAIRYCVPSLVNPWA